MKLNNKGTTIIELIISIALLSVVMIFMYQLLNNVKFEKDSEYFASKNQEQRIEIIDYIENELEGTNSFFLTSDVTNKISSSSNTITYKGSSSKTWTLDSDYTLGSLLIKECKCIKECNPSDASADNEFLCEATIPIYTDNTDNVSGNNNILDDITFSFFNINDIP